MGGRGSSGGKRSGGGGSGISATQKEKALDRLENLNVFKTAGKENPNLLETPLNRDTKSNDAAIATGIINSLPDEAWDSGKVVSVNPNTLYTIQPFVTKSGVRNAITQETAHTPSSNMPLAVSVNNKLFLADGNHRASAAKLLGLDRIQIRVLN